MASSELIMKMPHLHDPVKSKRWTVTVDDEAAHAVNASKVRSVIVPHAHVRGYQTVPLRLVRCHLLQRWFVDLPFLVIQVLLCGPAIKGALQPFQP